MNKNEAQHLADTIKNEWKFPYVRAYVSSLGGEERSSVMVTVSLDPPSSWTNGILENSHHYAKMAFHSRGPEGAEFTHFSGNGIKLRGWKVADKAALYKKLQVLRKSLESQA